MLKKKVRFCSRSSVKNRQFDFYLRSNEAEFYRTALEVKRELIEKIKKETEKSAKEIIKKYPGLLSHMRKKDPYCALFYKKLKEKTGLSDLTISTYLGRISLVRGTAEAKADASKKRIGP